jgi:hypothetical protein
MALRSTPATAPRKPCRSAPSAAMRSSARPASSASRATACVWGAHCRNRRTHHPHLRRPIARWTDDLAHRTAKSVKSCVRGDQVTRSLLREPQGMTPWPKSSTATPSGTAWATWAGLTAKTASGSAAARATGWSRPTATLFTIPCEAIFNNHPRVFRSALVGVGPKGSQRPVVCIELEPGDTGKDKRGLKKELLALAKASPISEDDRNHPVSSGLSR